MQVNGRAYANLASELGVIGLSVVWVVLVIVAVSVFSPRSCFFNCLSCMETERFRCPVVSPLSVALPFGWWTMLSVGVLSEVLVAKWLLSTVGAISEFPLVLLDCENYNFLF